MTAIKPANLEQRFVSAIRTKRMAAVPMKMTQAMAMLEILAFHRPTMATTASWIKTRMQQRRPMALGKSMCQQQRMPHEGKQPTPDSNIRPDNGGLLADSKDPGASAGGGGGAVASSGCVAGSSNRLGGVSLLLLGGIWLIRRRAHNPLI